MSKPKDFERLGKIIARQWTDELPYFADMTPELRQRLQREQLVDMFREEAYREEARATGEQAKSRTPHAKAKPISPPPKRGIDR